MRSRTIRLLVSMMLAAACAQACQCERFSSCQEVAATNLVFIGTVEWIKPIFLNRWNSGTSDALKGLNDAFLAARQSTSDDTLAHLKDAYLKAFPEVSVDRRRQLQSAKTASGVASLFYSDVGSGMTVRLRAQSVLKHESGDDDDPKKDSKNGDHKNDEESAKPQFFDVWTPFGDCGVAFQTGETYLVYASEDQENNVPISTDSCTRTRRISDAGEDLAYLYFYKNHPEASTRLEGYVTSDRRYRLKFDPLHPERIQSPVGGLIVELQSEQLARFLEAEANGHFLFDGLPAGDYTLTAYTKEYPADRHQLGDPQKFKLPAKGCSLQVIVVPPDESKPK